MMRMSPLGYQAMIIRTTRDLAHLVRDRRARLALTQATLAKMVGVSRKWIVDLEAGKGTGDWSLILRTIKALGLDLEVRDRAAKTGKHDVDLDQIIEKSKRAPK